MSERPTLTPRSGFVVTLPAANDSQLDSWRLLYAPILGVAAFGLYSGLKTFANAQPQLSARRQHSELLTWLRLDLDHFLAARQRLEAAGLLDTYYQQDALGDVYVYQLQSPLSVTAFFDDDLLSVLLLQSVGQQRYDELIAKFEQRRLNTKNMQNVSADFLSVFHMSDAQLANRPARLKKQEDQHQANRQASLVHVDFKLLSDYLQREYVNLESVVAHRDLIVTEATMYGLNERVLANFIVQATSVTTNLFDPERFKQVVAMAFQSDQSVVTDEPKDEAGSTPVTSTGDNQDKTQIKALVAAVKAYAPADFLANLKQEKNQYVSEGEQRVLAKFMARHLFAPSVVNMLIYYLIGDRDQNVLYQNSVDRIANDWTKAKVQTPEQAIDHMRAYAQQQESKRQQRQSGRAPKSREQLTDWNATSQTPASEAVATNNASEIQKLRQRLNQAKQNQEDQ
ncbi:MAG TPA: hypothetical protein DCW31_00800 [Lactobacillus sp.]|nr:hypothetical protein [Lactobacillus sp.]